MTAEKTRSYFLRRALLANGVFSLLSGIILIVAAKPLSELFGVAMPLVLIATGGSLLVYAAALLRNALQKEVCQTEAFVAVVLDAAWVAGSAVLIFSGLLSTTGSWTVAIVAGIVLLFSAIQLYGIRTMRQERVGYLEKGVKPQAAIERQR